MLIRCLIAILFASAAHAAPLRIVALGDMPYGDPAEVYAPYRALIDTINEAPPALVIHVGDTKAGSTPCTDRMLADQLAFLNRFAAPVLYTPGDNEWTDCHRKKAGRFDPFERLAHLRATYFPQPRRTLGKPVALDHDPAMREQAALRIDDIAVLTLHVTGSRNGQGLRAQDAGDTLDARTAAAVRWLRAGFRAARGSSAVVVALHADMFRKDDFKPNKREWRKGSVFRPIGEALGQEAARFAKPVLLIFGDSHEYRVFQPLGEAPNLTAMEVYGAPDMHAVEVLIDPAAATPFTFRTITNPLRP